MDFKSYERIILFIKTNLSNKDVALVELYSEETVHYMDIISRDVYLPLLSSATHTFQVESVVLPLPAFNILAHISQQEPERQQSILSILGNTLTNWSKQIKQLPQEEL
ncbi:unnamed protein product [Rotaria sordida]|uniref:Uncharacterized protein n=1 Tax=Rotaria sordida TaxID=392033 RepID=A0A815H5B4_9BILA|nr:unnamed protein product [Rotaria sordida]CAF1600941.1 unnamed protein product [Rotaria sordida]